MKVRFEPEADEELSHATRYLARKSEITAAAFVEDVRAAVQLLLQFPRSGTPIAADVRRLLLKRHSYQLIYRVEGAEIRIYAVAHVKRRPGYWSDRLR